MKLHVDCKAILRMPLVLLEGGDLVFWMATLVPSGWCGDVGSDGGWWGAWGFCMVLNRLTGDGERQCGQEYGGWWGYWGRMGAERSGRTPWVGQGLVGYRPLGATCGAPV